MRQESHIETLSRRIRQERSRTTGQRGGTGGSGAEDPEPIIEDLIDGRFRLLRRIGSGRLGDIYESRIDGGPDAGIGRLVALQLFNRSITSDLALIDRLRRGYAALRAGPHPNIVRLEEMGRNGKTWFIVMELLQGVSLRTVLGDAGELAADEAMPIARAVGDALSYLHAKGMVHGGLTASAVFVTEEYEVRLLDIVPALPTSVLPSEDEGPGSDSMRAPDAKDDVYGLACLTYELLTAQHPYNYSTAAEARRLGLVPSVIPQLPPLRWRALERGLAPERAHRPSNVNLFLKDLGVSGSERLADPAQAPLARENATSGRVPPVTVDASDRLAAAPTATDSANRRWLRWSGIVAVLAGLVGAIWVYQDPLRDIAVDRLAALGVELVAGGGVERIDGTARPEVANPNDVNAESVAVSGAGIELDPESETDSEGEAASEIDAAEQAEIEPGDDDIELDLAARPGIPVDTETATGSERIDDVEESTTEDVEPRFVLAENMIRVRESDSVAAITVLRQGSTSSRSAIVWWTSSESARADDDYADFGEQTEEFSPEVERLTLYVPLVDDGIPEPVEQFVVNIGRADPATGLIGVIGTVRVEIEDDDSRSIR